MIDAPQRTDILFVCYKMDLGGTEKSLLSLINGLNPSQFNITLLLLKDGGKLYSHIPKYVKVELFQDYENLEKKMYGSLKHLIRSNNIQIFSVILMYLKIKVTGNWFYACEAALKNFHKTYTADIAIAYSGPSDFISYFIAKKVPAKKKIQWIHFDIEKVVTNYKFGKKYYPAFDHICCVSQSAKDIFLKHFPQMTAKTEVFHNIVSETEIKKQAVVGETFVDNFDAVRILTVGRFTKEKGQHLLLEAVARLKADNLRFRWYLIGDGMEKNTVQAKAQTLDIADHLFFLGEKENPYRYMQDCNIYVQPSLHEGYGITVAEAQVFNKPIVVTNFASAKDLVEDNDTGLITDISSEGIYKAVRTLILNPDLRRKFSVNSLHSTAKPEYDLSKFLN